MASSENDSGSSTSPPGSSNDSSSPPPPSDNNPSPPSDQSSSSSNSEDNSNSNSNNNNNNNNDSGNNNGNNNNDSSGNNNNNNNNNNGDNNNNNSPPSQESNSNDSPNGPPSAPSIGSNGGSRSSSFSPNLPLSDGSSASSSRHNNTTLIAGLIVGIGVLLLLLIIIIIVLCCKKKKQKRHDTMQYYRDPSQKGQQQPPQQYYSGQHGPWQTSPSQDMNYSGASGMNMNQWGTPMAPPPDMSAGYSSGPAGPALPPPHPSMALGFSKSSFSYEELAAATNGFAQANMLGQGGFGYVHKGVLPNGKEVAVKSLKSGSGQGEREFQAEVEIISRVHHRHLVSLVGYCIAGGQRMLVYEFVPNNTLEYHLHGKGRPVMDFATRMRIALGSAKGLAYLHEDCHPRIIHRDIKTANILIDLSFEAKVADFGLAKLSSDTNTHVSTRVMGTFGYLAPEYASSGKLTEKSDVFSFGIMLLELVTGRRPIDPSSEDEDSLVDWARPLISRAIEEGALDELVDPRLEGQYDTQEMLRLIACAGSSVRHSARRRPKMSQIVRVLEGDVSLDDLNEGAKKGGNSSAFNSSGGSSDYDTASYNNDMKNFRRIALSSTDYTSSEYGATNEYDHV